MYIYSYWYKGKIVCKWSVGTRFIHRSRHTKDSKMILHASLHNTKHYKMRNKDKWSNPGKGVVTSHTHRCSSYWKRSLWVALDYGRLTYLLAISFKIIQLLKSGNITMQHSVHFQWGVISVTVIVKHNRISDSNSQLNESVETLKLDCKTDCIL